MKWGAERLSVLTKAGGKSAQEYISCLGAKLVLVRHG